MARIDVQAPRKAQPQLSSLVSSRMGPGIVLTTMSGRITEAVCEEKLPEFQSLLRGSLGATWVIDVEGITGFEPKAVMQGSHWFSAFVAAEGANVVFVSRHAPARMAAQALAFGAGVNLRCFTSLSEAYQHLKLPG